MREGWEYKKLGDIVSFCSGSRPQGGVGTISEGALSLGGEHIGKDGHISLSTPKYVSLEYYTNNSKGHIEDNDILLCKDGALTGKVAILRDELKEQKAMVNEHVFILRSVKTTQPFLFYYLYSPSGQIHLKQRISGAAQGGLNGANLKTIPIPIPPLSVQQQIVSELDLLSSVIEKQKAQIEELDKLAQSIFYDMFGDPVENEKGWEVKKLGEVCSHITDGDHMPPPKADKGIPFITISNIDKDYRVINFEDTFFVPQSYYDNLKDERKARQGDVLYTVTGSYGIPVIVVENKPFCFQRHIALLRPNNDYLLPQYLCYWALMDSVKQMADDVATGIAQKTVGLSSLRKFVITIPPLSLQQEFADKIQAMESMKAKVRQSLKESETLFNSRMDFYFS